MFSGHCYSAVFLPASKSRSKDKATISAFSVSLYSACHSYSHDDRVTSQEQVSGLLFNRAAKKIYTSFQFYSSTLKHEVGKGVWKSSWYPGSGHISPFSSFISAQLTMESFQFKPALRTDPDINLIPTCRRKHPLPQPLSSWSAWLCFQGESKPSATKVLDTETALR